MIDLAIQIFFDWVPTKEANVYWEKNEEKHNLIKIWCLFWMMKIKVRPRCCLQKKWITLQQRISLSISENFFRSTRAHNIQLNPQSYDYQLEVRRGHSWRGWIMIISSTSGKVMKNCGLSRQQTCHPVIHCFDPWVSLSLTHLVIHVFEIQIDAFSYLTCLCCDSNALVLVIDFAIVFGCCY